MRAVARYSVTFSLALPRPLVGSFARVFVFVVIFLRAMETRQIECECATCDERSGCCGLCAGSERRRRCGSLWLIVAQDACSKVLNGLSEPGLSAKQWIERLEEVLSMYVAAACRPVVAAAAATLDRTGGPAAASADIGASA